jgi:hypothetical protein
LDETSDFPVVVACYITRRQHPTVTEKARPVSFERERAIWPLAKDWKSPNRDVDAVVTRTLVAGPLIVGSFRR